MPGKPSPFESMLTLVYIVDESCEVSRGTGAREAKNCQDLNLCQKRQMQDLTEKNSAQNFCFPPNFKGANLKCYQSES
jgi:hypothetical protein